VSSHRARVEEIIEQLNTRDPRMADMCHPEIEWRWPSDTPGVSVFRGTEELQRGLYTWAESWGELNMEPEEILEDGDYVLAMIRYRMRGAGSGLLLEQSVAHLHQFESGLLRRWWMFGDADKARRRFLAGDRPAAP
jgi:ketosteroid isomerase-like protein